MPKIFRVVTNYKPPFDVINTNGEEALQCKKLDLYRTMITVGNPSFFTLKDINDYGFFRALYDSILRKIALVSVNVQSDKLGIRRHPIFDGYVSDEKRIVSYNLGMAFAKLYSEKLLEIPNLIHIEFLKKQGAITFIKQQDDKRPKEPDLVGQTSDGCWHVFEAKGVSTSISQLSGKIIEAKNQVKQVATIHGVMPSTGTACATYIGPDRILSYLEDPPGLDGKQLDINRRKFIESYYSPFLVGDNLSELTLRKESMDGFEVDFFDLKKGSRKLSIGLEREVSEQIRGGDYNIPSDILSRLKEYSAVSDINSKYSIGLDGFVVSYTEY